MKGFIICVLVGAGLPGAVAVYALTALTVQQSNLQFETIERAARFVVADSPSTSSTLANSGSSMLEGLNLLGSTMSNSNALFISDAFASATREDVLASTEPNPFAQSEIEHPEAVDTDAVVEQANLVFANSKVAKLTLPEVPAPKKAGDPNLNVASTHSGSKKVSCDSEKQAHSIEQLNHKPRTSFKT
ncbi:MAG: hypothetical protein AAF431_18015 [Pseudomonadota bacterium]